MGGSVESRGRGDTVSLVEVGLGTGLIQTAAPAFLPVPSGAPPGFPVKEKVCPEGPGVAQSARSSPPEWLLMEEVRLS